jgi:hypothetical protein
MSLILSINNYINTLHELSSKNKIDEFTKFIIKNGIHYKIDEDEQLIIIYNQFGKTIKNEYENECRSIIFTTLLDLVSYTFDDPLCNSDAKHYLLNTPIDKLIISQCYEGTLLSIYFHNNKWYCSTKKLIDSKKSHWNNEKSHFELMEECLNVVNVDNFDIFCKVLNEDKCYYFVLIHHENENIVNYSHLWGEKYKKLMLICVRDKNTQLELNIYDDLNDLLLYDYIINKQILLPEQYSDLSILEQENNKGTLDIPVQNEGIIVKALELNINKYIILKLQTIDYQFARAIDKTNNIYKGLLKLYQIGELNTFLNNNKNFEKYKKIEDPNSDDCYDIVGTIDSIFKICSNELFELFNKLWDLKSGKHLNIELYNNLPVEYKNILYGIRGIYFKKKASFIQNKKNNIHIKSILKITDIYTYLKKLNIDKLINLLMDRNDFIETINNGSTNIAAVVYKEILDNNESIMLKLTSLYVNVLIY